MTFLKNFVYAVRCLVFIFRRDIQDLEPEVLTITRVSAGLDSFNKFFPDTVLHAE